MNYDLDIYLKDLNDRINPQVEEDILSKWTNFVEGKDKGGVFSPRRLKVSPPNIDWPHIMVNDAIEDIDLMILQQLEMCSNILKKGSGEILNFRCNFGTGIIPSLFGAEIFEVEYNLDTLPCCRALPNGKESIKEIVENGMPDLNTALGKKVFDVANRFLEVCKDYPNISKYVVMYVPDTQGPLAISEILWGSDLYMDIFDSPELVHNMMDLAVDTFVAFTKKWYDLVPPITSKHGVDWGLLHKGHVLIRNDAAMNISPDMYDSYVKMYDQKILDEFNGGVIHFCGRGDHYIQFFHEMDGVHAINMSQPECNNMAIIYENTVDKDIQIIGLLADEAMRCEKEDQVNHQFIHSGAAISAWIDEDK